MTKAEIIGYVMSAEASLRGSGRYARAQEMAALRDWLRSCLLNGADDDAVIVTPLCKLMTAIEPLRKKRA